MSTPQDSRLAAVRAGFTLAALVVCIGLPMSIVGVSRFGNYGRGTLFNVCLLCAEWLLFELVARLPRARWLSLVLVPLVVFELGLVFAHAWYFDVAIERQLTPLDMSWSGLWYFFRSALPPAGLATMLAWSAVLAGLSWLFTRYRPLGTRWLRLQASAAALVVAGMPAALSVPRLPSPLYDASYEQWQLLTSPRLVAGDAPSDPRFLAALDRSGLSRGSEPPRYRKVIVLVMETMTAAQFAREGALLPPDTFVRAERAHLHSHERYFPNNQDSRTGMLDMLFSRLIPYEAYSDDGVAHYGLLPRDASLVDRMKALSYSTAFAVSQTTLEEVVEDLTWDATLNLSERDVADANAKQQLCFTPDEWESSCEDLVLLPRVLDFVEQHERAFVYQEFIWGHAAIYNQASGKTNTEYYSAYVDALRAGLKQRGLLDDTLVALTSDHGFRDKLSQRKLEAYRMPLLFHASDLPASNDARLYSHIDFARLLFQHLSPADAPSVELPDNELVMIVGPTGQGHMFVVGRQGGELLTWRRAGRDHELTHVGKLPLAPDVLLALFQQYRGAFDEKLRALPSQN